MKNKTRKIRNISKIESKYPKNKTLKNKTMDYSTQFASALEQLEDIMKKKGESSDVKGKLKVKPESLHSQSLNSLTFSKELDLANNSVFKDLSTNKAAEDVVGDYALDSEHLETNTKESPLIGKK